VWYSAAAPYKQDPPVSCIPARGQVPEAGFLCLGLSRHPLHGRMGGKKELSAWHYGCCH